MPIEHERDSARTRILHATRRCVKVRTDEHQGVFSLVDSPARKFLFRSQMLSHALFSSSWLQLTDEAKGAGAASLINLDDQGHQLTRINGKLVSVDGNLV